MESLLRGRQGREIRKMVARRLTSNDRTKTSWKRIMPLFINVTIEMLYPLISE